MARRPITAATFVEAVHRRLIVVRLLEQIGHGIFIGSILAIVLITVAIWHSMPVLPILLFCGILGFLIGCGLSIHRWPSRLIIATEADHQLRMQDLLTTALFSTPTTNDEFLIAVRAMADARCQTHLPSEVILRRLGIRNWSAIVLSLGIAITLAAIPMSSTASQAIDPNSAVLSADNNALLQSRGPMPITNKPISESASSNSTIAEPLTEPVATDSNPSPGKPKTGNAAGDRGGGLTTRAKSNQNLQSTGSAGQPTNAKGTLAGGGNSSTDQSQHSESSTGTKITHESASPPVPEWNGDSPTDSRPGMPMADEQIPPKDRDLVREFFNRR